MNTMRIVLEIAQETKKMRMMMRMMRTQTTLETAWERMMMRMTRTQRTLETAWERKN